MKLFQCELTLHDTLYFATREMGTLFETERYIHNYALAYALFSNTLLSTPYFCNSYHPNYAEDLQALNDAAVYVTPAQPLVWDYMLITWKIAQDTYHLKSEKFGDTKRNYPANIGRAKEIAPESVFSFYILSKEIFTLPRWIRLGKWMSKAYVEIKSIEDIEDRRHHGSFSALGVLNPLDIGEASLQVFDIISMPPSSLITNVRLEGNYYEIGGPGRGIPTNMRYTVPNLSKK
jgi:CRISPR-associated protein Csc1